MSESRYFEVIADHNDFVLVKDNYLDTQQSGNNNNPGYTQKIETVYVKKARYYIIQDDSFKAFRLKKSNVLALFKDADKVASFAKENKLSYKKIEDLRKILSYAQTLER